MEDKKLAAIQAAYGEYWDKVSPFVNSNGYCLFDYSKSDITLAGIHYAASGFKQFEVDSAHKEDVMYWRPKSLSGFESNNGWTRVDECLPKNKGDYYVCINGELNGEVLHSHEICLMGNPLEVSHWGPIDPVKPPIY